MKHITNFFGVGCVALLAMLIVAPGAFAQQLTKPNPPDDLEARAGAADETTGDQQGRITLTWSPVTGDDNGGRAVPLTDAGYQIEVSKDGDIPWTVVPDGEITVTPAAESGDPTKFTAVHILPEESDTEDPENPTPSHNLTRHYRVSAINIIGTGDPSDPEMATTHNVPDPPTDLAAVAGDATDDAADQQGRITLTWSPINKANNGGIAVANTAGLGATGGYMLEFWDTEADPPAWTEITAGVTNADPGGTSAVPKFTVVHDLSSLDPDYNITRRYRVRAISAAGQGDNSPEVSGTTHDVPGVPRGVTVSGVTVTSTDAALNDIGISWNAVSGSDLPITGYNVQRLTDAAAAAWADITGGTPVAPVAGKVDTADVGLAENVNDPPVYVTYHYRVRAVSAAGDGDWSEVTTGVKLAPPGVPTEFTAVALDKRETIALSWTAPMNDGEPDDYKYKIELSEDYTDDNDDGNDTWGDLPGFPADYAGRAYRHRNLTAGKKYHYRVSAVNVVGESATTDIVSVISSDKALAPRNLSAMVDADGVTINLSWDEPEDNDAGDPGDGGSPIRGYKIEVSEDGGTTWADVEEDKLVHPESELFAQSGDKEYEYSHVGGDPGTSYTYRVSAVNDAGPGVVSASSATVSLDAGAPGAPTDLTLMSAVDMSAITLEWAAPASDGGSPITGYEIEWSSDGTDGSWEELAIAITDDGAAPPETKFSAVHTGLKAGTEYHYRVKAINVASPNGGDFSDPEFATTGAAPDAPTTLTPIPSQGRSAISLLWTAPADIGGSNIVGYKIEVTTEDPSVAASWPEDPLVENTGNTDVIYSHTGLKAVTEYHYRVSAINGHGTGDPSDVASATTLVVAPNPPNDLAAVATPGVAGSVTLSWSPVADAENGGSPILEGTDGYSVEVTDDPTGGSWATSEEIVVTAPDPDAEPATTMFSAVHTLTADPSHNLTRYYRVKAINATSAAGGDFSASASATTHNVPDPPSDLVAAPTPGAAGSITLSWSPVADEDNGGLPITEGTAGYSVEVTGDPTDETSWATSTEIVITAPDPDAEPATTMFSAVHTLTADPSHNLTRYYRVKATNAAGTGGSSGAVSETTHDVPDPPNDLAAEPTEGAAGSITLSWSPVAEENNGGLPVTEGTAGYSVEVTGDPTDAESWATSEEIVVTAPDPDAEPATTMFSAVHTLTADLSHNLMRHYRVKAINAASADGGDFSASVSATTHNVPAPPSDLAAVATEGTAGSITLSWSPVAVENNGGLPIAEGTAGYRVEVTGDPTDETSWATSTEIAVTAPDPDAEPATTMFSAVHTLTADPSHNLTRHYRVKAINAASTDGGDFSASVSATTHNVPAPPTDLRTMARGEGTVVLTWTAPDVDRGPAITGYKIEVSENYSDSAPDAATWTDLMANTGSADVTYSHSGLTDGDTRHYRVSAISSAGTGTPSDVATVTTAIVTRYAISSGGSSSGDCTTAIPCTLEAAIEAGAVNDVVLVRIRRTGEIAVIREAITIDTGVTLGVYVRGDGTPAKGGVGFRGSVKLMSDANLMTHKDAAVHFAEIEIAGTPSIDELIIAQDVTIDEVDDPDNTMTSVLAVDELSVNSGQTLTIGEGANLRVRLTKGGEGKEMNGKFEVEGTVDGGGDLWIAHTSDERAASGFMLHEPEDYLPDEAIAPSKFKFTPDDCLMVTGGGTVENDLYAVAAGNVCVSLEGIGNLVAVGSIDGTEDITTDVIFRTAVTAKGDIQQWNDARVIFEQNAMIEGNVTLDYGDPGVGATFGAPVSTPADFERVGDSGVEFAGAFNTIEGDLALEFDGDSGSNQALFSRDSRGNSLSTVEGDLIIEDGGEIHLQASRGNPTDATDNPRAHSLSVEGDVFVYANAEIAMGVAAGSTISGDADVCSAPGLGFGNKVTLSGDVVFTEGAELTIHTVVIADDVTVEEEGTLRATTVHVTEDGELDSEGNVRVENALILEGEGLEGSLANGSTVDYLTYATIDSDEVALNHVDRLSVDVGADNTLRISSAATLKDLGLCSGAVALVDPDPDTDRETIKVLEHLVVKDGTLVLDTSRPGSIVTDETKPIASANDGYILKYVTGGEYMAGLEWFAPRKVAVDHKDAVIIVNKAKSLAEGVHIFKGHLHMKGDGSHLTIGMPSVTGISPFVMVDNGELHSNGNNVLVYGTATVATDAKQVGKIVTGGGELHVLGRNPKGVYVNESAVATVGKGGTIDVGMGALQLGPAYTAPANGLEGGNRPDVRLTVMGAVTGKIFVPAGSKETWITGEAFDTVVLDAAPNPKGLATGAGNWGGGLYFHDTKVVIDSLAAMNDGAVEFYDQTDPKTDKYAIEIKKDVELNSARIYVNAQNSLKFGGNLTFGETGGMRVWDDASVTVMGDFTQNAGSMHAGNQDGVGLAGTNTFTVMGDFMVADGAHRFESNMNTSMVLKGDFHFGAVKVGSDKMLNANLEFSAKEAQTVGSAADLGDVVVNNSEGLVLSDSVSQGTTSTLILTNGVISSDMYPWAVKNPGIEEDVRGRNNALMTCDADENCARVITGGTRRSHLSTAGVSRYVMKGSSGEGELSGGYLFPVGDMDEDRAYYRPLILQLEDDLTEAMPVTVSPMMASADMMPSWPGENIVVPVQGGSLTLDTHADIFWKVEIKDMPDLAPHIRIAANGLANVFDASRLRIVQWDCDWSNARLAGRQINGTDQESFAENGYVNGVLNLTQESVEIETCGILGVAANGIENPIHLDPLTGGLTRVQFIHNLPLPFSVDLFLDGVKLMSGLDFQSATGYLHAAAGDHVLKIAPVGVPADTIEVPLPSLANGQSYAVIAHGALANPSIKRVNTKLKSSVENMVEAILVHGSGDLGDVDVRVLDPADNTTPTKLLANNFSFDSATRYLSLAPGAHSVQVTSPDNREEVEVYYLDLNGYQGETLILNLSGGKDDLGLMGVSNSGDVFLSQVVTGVEEEGTAEVPTEFTLHGNYPNPFNPSTRIEFDLPEAAQVTLQVVDMLGREVMTLPAREFEAGANRTLELNAINMASGTYLYRMIATGAENRYVKTGRMTLVK